MYNQSKSILTDTFLITWSFRFDLLVPGRQFSSSELSERSLVDSNDILLGCCMPVTIFFIFKKLDLTLSKFLLLKFGGRRDDLQEERCLSICPQTEPQVKLRLQS